MKAKKGNKVYRITEDNKKRYLQEGYDIYDDEGNVTEYSPLKTVPYGDYIRLASENESLHKRIGEMEAEMKENQSDKKATGKKAGE